ncbi:MAG: glycosyltransferase family 4 protein, partial [Thermodesulfobacteriota bacterium]
HSILRSKAFIDLYEEKRIEQKTNFIKYLKSFNVDFEKEGLNIVDVGWKGSIQDNIFFSLGGDIPVNGYYIGLLNPTTILENNRKTGILFSNFIKNTPYFDVYRSNTSLFEILLAASHGSADGYFADNSEEDSRNGIWIKTAELPEERKLFEEQIRPIQEHIKNTCRDLDSLTSITQEPIPDEEWFATKHARMVFRPRSKEINFFQSLYHLENFGIFEFTDFNSGKKLSIGKRLKNMRRVIDDPSYVLEKWTWYPIVLNRLGVGFMTRSFGERLYQKTFGADEQPSALSGKKLITLLDHLNLKNRFSIAFFLGIPDINGGTNVIYEHALRLKKKGHDVFILTREEIDPVRYAWHPEAGSLTWLTLVKAGPMRFDFAVATWWQSIILLRHINAAAYLYFVQSIESRFFPPDDKATYEEKAYKRLAENSYLMPIPVITEALWIKKYLNEHYGIDAFLVRNGIRKDIYTESGKAHLPRESGKLRVLVEGPLGVPYKNVEKAVAVAGKSDADEVWLLTSSKTNRFDGADRLFSQVPIHETPWIYRSCDVLLKLSTVEGMFGPPLEMFHCGGTSIVYDVTGHDEYIRHNINSFVLPIGDEEGVIRHLNLLKHQPETLARLKKGAADTAGKWPDWELSSNEFEKTLHQLKGRSWPNRTYLSKASDYFFQTCEHDIKLFYEQEQKPTTQCYQLYWHFGEGFSEPKSWKTEYQSSNWVTIKKILKPLSGKIFLRIDPSIQTGIIFIDQITVTDALHHLPVVRLDKNTGWRSCKITGTASLISNHSALVLESTGSDPQITLDSIEVDETVEEIEIEIRLNCMSCRLGIYEALKPTANEIVLQSN